MKPRVLVVDDEPLARAKILRLLRGRGDSIVVGTCNTAAQATEAIRHSQPDLIFLDIQLPDRDGFSVLEEVGADAVPAVVFVTAYDEFALRAFEAHAIDYLLKPYDAERFDIAYERARVWLAGGAARGADPRLRGLVEAASRSRAGQAVADGGLEYLAKLLVPSPAGEAVVPVAEVDWLQAAGNYIEVHRAGTTYLLRESLTALEASLDPANFARIHRRAIVNLSRIEEVRPLASGDCTLVLRGGMELRMSRLYRPAVRAALGASLRGPGAPLDGPP